MSFRPVIAVVAALLASAAWAQSTPPSTPAAAGSAASPTAGIAWLSGDAKVGQTKATVCGACHGMDGNSTMSQYPKLAGQNAHYLVEQLKHFKSGMRKNPIMAGMAAPLSVQDMRDIAAYFSSQQVSVGVTDDALVKTGRALFRGGDAARKIPACMSCHGPDGAGNPGPPYPHLAGQHADYVQAVLSAWKGGDVWGTDAHAKIMPSIAARLTKADIAALASYIEGLHTATPAAKSAVPVSP